MKKLTEHFYEYEFRCRCQRADCDATPMDPAFMRMLEGLRVEWGKPLTPISGQRCRYHNSKISGAAKNSQHLHGKACDFVFSKRSTLEAFVILAEKAGFMGIGWGKGKVHIDSRKTRARWNY